MNDKKVKSIVKEISLYSERYAYKRILLKAELANSKDDLVEELKKILAETEDKIVAHVYGGEDEPE